MGAGHPAKGSSLKLVNHTAVSRSSGKVSVVGGGRPVLLRDRDRKRNYVRGAKIVLEGCDYCAGMTAKVLAAGVVYNCNVEYFDAQFVQVTLPIIGDSQARAPWLDVLPVRVVLFLPNSLVPSDPLQINLLYTE